MPRQGGSGRPAEPGGFLVEYSEGYATLTVSPPTGASRPVYTDDVLNRLRILGVPRVQARGVDEIVSAATGKPVRLVEWPEGELLSARLDMRITEDRLEARATMLAPRKGGGRLSTSDVLASLEEAGVRVGIDEVEISRMIDMELYDWDLTLARGRDKQDGRPASVEYTFSADVGKPYLFFEDGRVDLRELHFVQNKAAGDILATVRPPVSPRDGIDVHGETIPAAQAGPSNLVKAGENTKSRAKGTEIVALIDGNVFIRAGAVHMEPVVTVENVDYGTGNIDFEGSVVIKGGVADGFSVRSGGSIEIGECVGRTEVIAQRDILLRGGVNAAGEGQISAGGDVYAKYVESTNLLCGGNLVVDEVIMHSRFDVTGCVLLKGRRAEIIGGVGVVGGSLWCRGIGGASEVATRVTVGIEPEEVRQYTAAIRELDGKGDRLDELHANIARLSQSRSKRPGLEEKTEKALAQLRQEAAELQAELTTLATGIKARKRALKSSPGSVMVVEDQMHPNTVIAFGRQEYRVPTRGAERTVLRIVDGSISESGFNPGDPPHFPLARRR